MSGLSLEDQVYEALVDEYRRRRGPVPLDFIVVARDEINVYSETQTARALRALIRRRQVISVTGRRGGYVPVSPWPVWVVARHQLALPGFDRVAA